jgi:hypothetical protein
MPGLEVLCSIQHRMLTFRVNENLSTTTPGDQGVANEVLRVPMESVVVSVRPEHYSMFALSSQDGDGADEVYCYARDQTTRNKWMAVFRRQGVAIYTRCRNGHLSRVLEPVCSPSLRNVVTVNELSPMASASPGISLRRVQFHKL